MATAFFVATIFFLATGFLDAGAFFGTTAAAFLVAVDIIVFLVAGPFATTPAARLLLLLSSSNDAAFLVAAARLGRDDAVDMMDGTDSTVVALVQQPAATRFLWYGSKVVLSNVL